MYIHTYKHTYTHTHTHIHTYIHSFIHTYIHTHHPTHASRAACAMDSNNDRGKHPRGAGGRASKGRQRVSNACERLRALPL